MARFYAPGAANGQRIALPPDEAEHLTRVLRLKAGAAIHVFDGIGHEYEAIVESATKSGVRIVVGEERIAVAREPRVSVTLVQSVLKGDKMDTAIRDAVMMGAFAIQPAVTARSEVTLTSLRRRQAQDRWQRIAISSAKQCGRAVVPLVLDALEFPVLVDTEAIGSAFMLVEPTAADKMTRLSWLTPEPPVEASIFVGPEGGWTSDEVERGSHVAHLVTLGSRTFRADAMATVALAAFFTLWKEY